MKRTKTILTILSLVFATVSAFSTKVLTTAYYVEGSSCVSACVIGTGVTCASDITQQFYSDLNCTVIASNVYEP